MVQWARRVQVVNIEDSPDEARMLDCDWHKELDPGGTRGGQRDFGKGHFPAYLDMSQGVEDQGKNLHKHHGDRLDTRLHDRYLGPRYMASLDGNRWSLVEAASAHVHHCGMADTALVDEKRNPHQPDGTNPSIHPDHVVRPPIRCSAWLPGRQWLALKEVGEVGRQRGEG